MALSNGVKSLKNCILEDERNCKNTKKNSIFESSRRNRLHCARSATVTLVTSLGCWWQGCRRQLPDGYNMNIKNRISEVLHSSSTLISLGCDELEESSNAKERVQFLLSHVCKEEFIFYCLKTQKESERFHLYQKPVSRDRSRGPKNDKPRRTRS